MEVAPGCVATIDLSDFAPGAKVRINENGDLSLIDAASAANPSDARPRRTVANILENSSEFVVSEGSCPDFGQLPPDSIGVYHYQFPGQGQRLTPVGNLAAVEAMLWQLPGRHGAKYRKMALAIVQRYRAGDVSMIQEVQANAASDGPVQQLARHALGIQKVTTTKYVVTKEEQQKYLPYHHGAMAAGKQRGELVSRRDYAELNRLVNLPIYEANGCRNTDEFKKKRGAKKSQSARDTFTSSEKLFATWRLQLAQVMSGGAKALRSADDAGVFKKDIVSILDQVI